MQSSRMEMMKVLGASETPLLSSSTPHSIPEDDILLSHGSENPKSYVALIGWTL
jgi:hypothetical protein